MRNGKNYWVLAIAVIAGLLLTVLPMAAASPYIAVSGGWTGSNQQVTNMRVEGGNVFVDISNDGQYVPGGSISGNFHQTFTAVIHFGDPKLVKTLDPTKPQNNPPANFNWMDMDRVFQSATVLGHTGGLTMRLQAKGYGNTFTGAWNLEGTWVIIGGTGDLAGLHGQGTWWHTQGVPGLQYEGKMHFDP